MFHHAMRRGYLRPLQVVPGTPGQRKNLPIECAQGDRPARCPNLSLLWTSLLLFHGDVTCFDVMKLLAGCDVVGCEVNRRVCYCGYSCDVSCHVISCDVIACVVSCRVMQCDVMVMSCYLLCPAMGWNVMSLRCHWLWGHVVWFEVVLWRRESTILYNKVQLCTTPVLLQYSYEKWHSDNIITCCARHEKWHRNIIICYAGHM